MTAVPVPPARMPLPRPLQQLLTAAAYAALPESSDARYELQEGAIVMSPRPAVRHQDIAGSLYVELRARAPHDLKVLQEVDVDLQLVPADQPATVRVPDIVVVTRAGFDRVNADGGLLTAAEVQLAVEVVSPSSTRTDHRIKHDEYADAGIPHYWIVDIDERPTLTAHHLAGEFGYATNGPVTGTFTATQPFPVRLDLDNLS